MEDKYIELLDYFGVKKHWTDILETTSYVNMDNIHDAILFIGLDFSANIKYYIIKAKQMAIDEHRKDKRRYEISMYNAKKLMGKEFEFDFLLDYNFTEIELDLVNELLSGVKAYKSAIPRRQYQKVLNSIKEKMKLHYESTPNCSGKRSCLG